MTLSDFSTRAFGKKVTRGAVSVALACAVPFGGAAHALDEITIAYFLEWPTPNQVAQIEETYDKELGVKVNWKSFGSGNDMSAAMAGGDVQIAYSQGLIPFIVATSRGQEMSLVGVAVGYAEADNCVVSNKSPLDRSSAAATANSLKGKKIATPIGNVTHYKLLKTLAYFGLSERDVEIIPVDGGASASAAFLTGQVDVGCAFGGPLDKMKAEGQVIMTGAEQENIGILTFDVISVADDFAEEHPDMVVKFLQVTEDANKRFADDKNRYWGTLAQAAGMTEDGVKGYLGANGTFSFPTKDEQLSSLWFGGTLQSLLKGAADFFVEQGQIDKALSSYDGVIDDSYLKKVR